MAEINERASNSIDCPLSPTVSISNDVQRISKEMSDKVYTFIHGEMEGILFFQFFKFWKNILGTINDYKLLEDMNNVTSQRYSDMKHVADSISSKLLHLHQKCILTF